MAPRYRPQPIATRASPEATDNGTRHPATERGGTQGVPPPMDTYALEDQVANRRRKRRRVLLAILLSASLATLGAGAMSLAVFTDSDATGGSWTAGTIILGVGPAPVFTAANIFPGDSGSQTVTVSNTGTGQLRYAMTTTTTDSGAGLDSQAPAL